ncbi:glycosyltransferase family 2 protein [bacterium C-53]|nr:glycosyltransferase family 2 protein [Lachnospiraceae bacterium]NBI04313.1 glycosyltransferase family 2 protein [Lachnospiraceae bacterium]RKJ08480.1 glycosyltransferase family 2 protein [bacterium C-53]
MTTISLCMIVKNEEKTLARCLDSVHDLVDEIIIVDTGSSDRTTEIAAKFTSKIYNHSWTDDFAAARNVSFSKASMKYCMWLDADDILEQTEREKFLQLKQSLPSDTDIVMMKYNTSFDEKGTPLFSYYRERLIKNAPEYRWAGEVHEAITPAGKIFYSDIAVSHKKDGPGDPDRNLRIYQKMIENGKTLNARQLYYYGRELYYHKKYDEAASVFEQFLSMPDGWIENKIETCSICADCYYRLDKKELSLSMLLHSLSFDTPRAELCCDIGNYFMKCENYQNAIYWYETALSRERRDHTGGFILPDCYDYIPLLQLCVCHDRLGDRETARKYNEKAGLCKPYSKAYLYNKKYFDTVL